MTINLWYNGIGCSRPPETNNRSAIVPVPGVLAADPIYHNVGFGELLPATGHTSYRGSGVFMFLRRLGDSHFMSTSKLQRYVSRRLSIHFGHYTIRENFRPDWLIDSDGARLELDFYIEEIKIAIEVQGEQHYRYCKFFHENYDDFPVRLARDKWKCVQSQSLGIRFIEIASKYEADLAIVDLMEEKKKVERPSSRNEAWNEVYDMLSEIELGKNHIPSGFRKKKRAFKLIANTLRRLEIDGKPLNEKRRQNLQAAIRSVASWLKQDRNLTDEECLMIHLSLLALETKGGDVNV